MKSHFLNRVLPMSLRSTLRRAALQTIPSMRHLDMGRRLTHMAHLGFAPKVIVDVGAAQGCWARMASKIWPGSYILGVEPNLDNIPFLEQTKRDLRCFDCVRAFLGPEQKTVHYKASGDQTSLLEETGANCPDEAPMLTLDSLRGRLPGPADFIKLDVQGFELEVLKGGDDTLQGCQAALLEVSFFPFFPGVPIVNEVIQFMTDKGFAWYDVMGIYRRPADDALAQLDLMFVRSDHPLRASTAI